MIAVLILIGLVVAGLVIGFAAVNNAPTGYQDETGFHYGPGQEHGHEELATAVAQARLA